MKPSTLSTFMFLIITILTRVSSLAPASKDTVKMILEVSRHGSRAPADMEFPSIKWIKTAGLGELTQSGARQHYILGLNTKKRYPTIFSDGGTESLGNEEFWVRSTPYNRTLESAFAHMAGVLDVFKAPPLPFVEAKAPQNLPPQELAIDLTQITFNTALPHGLHTFPLQDMIQKCLPITVLRKTKLHE